MKKVAVLVALAGLAGVATAQSSYIDIKVRPAGSNDAWSDTLTLASSNLVDPIYVEVAAFYHRSTGYGLATVVHSITGSPYSAASGDAVQLNDRTDSSLHPDSRVGNFNFGGQFQVVYATGTSGVDANRFRIGANGNAADAAAGGISVKQNTPVALGTAFDTTQDVMGYKFTLKLACYNGGAARTVNLDAPKAKINSFQVYSTNTSSTPTSVSASLVNTDGASVTVSWAPAPASLGLLGMGALVAGRRRR